MKNFYTKILKVVFTTALFNLSFSQYANGYIVANEGNFGTPNAEISYINENNVITNNVYATANGGAQLGDVLQSIYFEGNRSFLVVNNSNKITVANRTTFVKVTDITDNIIQPRYTTVANGKIYTTNAGNSSSGTYVSVHNATTFAFIKKIPLSQNGEEILTVNGKVYVMKSYFGGGNSIEIIDPATDTITTEIVLSAGLQSIKASGSNIYAFCSNDSGSTVFKINTTTNTIEKSLYTTAVQYQYAYKFTVDGNNIYIANGLNVYSLTTDLTAFNTTPLFTVAASQGWDEFYGLSAIDGKIFQGNANGFTGGSILNVYNANGTFNKTYTATMGVNGVYKNVYADPSLAAANNSVSKIAIYPNPVSDILFIKNVASAPYKIFDLAGKLVKSGNYSNGISVSTLTKGAYIIQVTSQNKTISEKFIVK